MNDIIGPDLLSKRRRRLQAYDRMVSSGPYASMFPNETIRSIWQPEIERQFGETEKHSVVVRTDYCADPEHCTHHGLNDEEKTDG